MSTDPLDSDYESVVIVTTSRPWHLVVVGLIAVIASWLGVAWLLAKTINFFGWLK